MANVRRIPPLGASNASLALGAKDPRRTHRNPLGGTNAISKLDPVGADDSGRLTLRQKAEHVDSIAPAGATVDDAVTGFNELLRVLTEAGFLEE
jgi:hypothetical protein